MTTRSPPPGGAEVEVESAPPPRQVPSSARRRARPRTPATIIRYVFADLLKVFLFALGILELVYALFFAVVVARRYDLDLLLVFPVFWRTALSMLNDSVPLAALFATSLVYGRLIAEREITALRSFGLSAWQLLRPAVLLGFLLLAAGVAINGYIAPEANFAKRNIRGLLAAQLRYLGEGWNRDFRFGDKNLWILHHDGRNLYGVFLSSHSDDAGDILPEDVSRRVQALAYPVYLYAERGRLLFAEDLAQEAAREEGSAPRPADSEETVVIELRNVSLFISDQVLTRERTYFMQRPHADLLRIRYDPGGRKEVQRRPKHLTLLELLGRTQEVDRTLALALLRPQARARLEEERSKLLMEFCGRAAWTAAAFIFPLFAALVALFLNSSNRLAPFFAASLAAPAVFYGGASLGEVLARTGVPAWGALGAGAAILAFLSVGLFALLERGRTLE